MLLIQLLGMQWNKLGRNIEATRSRAAEPTALSFQTKEIPNPGECWVQGRESRQLAWEDRVVVGLVEVVRLYEDRVQVGLSADGGIHFGRGPEQGKPFILDLGQTVQFVVQVKCQYYHDAWFERHIANVAWLERFDPEVFRLRAFTHQFDYCGPFAR